MRGLRAVWRGLLLAVALVGAVVVAIILLVGSAWSAPVPGVWQGRIQQSGNTSNWQPCESLNGSANECARSFVRSLRSVNLNCNDTVLNYVGAQNMSAVGGTPVAVTYGSANGSGCIDSSNAYWEVATISTPPDESDLRALSVQELLVWCSGVLAFGLGYLMGPR